MTDVFKVKGLKKEDLKLVANDLGVTLTPEMNVADLRKKITENQTTKDDPEFVRDLLMTAVTDRKENEQEKEREREREEKEKEREREEKEKEREREEKERQLQFELQKAKQENDLKIELARIQASQVVNPNLFNPQAFSNEENNSKRKFTLPKLEFRKFGGDIKEWLPFWGQFSNIHNDEEIASEDKFQYLIQATVIGSRAREVIESFPPTGENYAKAVDSLKTRFGKEDLLIEVYVRELLKLIISVQTQEKPCITYLYDKLESYMRALDTLGVTTDKCASILYPMVESCFPHDFLKAWNRSVSSHLKKEAKDRLDDLMNFLKTEVEGEERISLAMSGFGLNKNAEMKLRNKKRIDENFNRMSTASSLFSGTDKKPLCVFCEKHHKSYECRNASNMSYDDKKSILLKKKACFRCLRPNHHSRSCTMANIKCNKCGARGHNTVMCYGKRDVLTVSKDTSKELNSVKQSGDNNVLSNQTDEVDVVLQTLHVRVKNDDKELIVRALIDTGSQRSYATQEVIEFLGSEPSKEVKVVHTLFGGKQTEEESHKEYILNLGDLENKFNCRIQVLDQKKICNEIARVPVGGWIREMERMNIRISDIEDKRKCKDNKIHLLIGADVAGKLLTGKLYHCQAGPVAVHTKLGWTLMGKIPRAQTIKESNMFNVTSLLYNNIENLWKLDLIGISESPNDKSEELIREETISHFKRTVKRDSEGRYEVALPWIHEKENLSNNKDVAEKRLIATTKKLENSGHLKEYGAIFQDWLSENIIERAPEI